MKSHELKQKREGLKATLKPLAEKAELTAEEKTQWEETYRAMEEVDRDIRIAEQKEQQLRIDASEKGLGLSEREAKDLTAYSFVRALQDYIKSGKLQGLELEMHQEAEREAMAIGNAISHFGVSNKVLCLRSNKRADITTSTAPLVPTNIMGFIDALYAKMLCVQFGATTMTGLTGNVSIPRVNSAATAGWATEVANAGDAGSDTESVPLSPKRLTCYQDISKQLIFQSPYSVEDLVRGLFINAMGVASDKAFIRGATNGPTGLLATSGIGNVAGGTDGAAPTLAHMLALIREVAVDDADFGNLAFMTNPKVRWKLQSTAIESGHPQRVWAVDVPDMLVGYKAGVTTQVPGDLDKGNQTGVCSAVIFGNWAEMVIAQFGPLDITVDTISQAIGSKVRITLNSWWDSALKHPASFAAMKDALANS